MYLQSTESLIVQMAVTPNRKKLLDQTYEDFAEFINVPKMPTSWEKLLPNRRPYLKSPKGRTVKNDRNFFP